MTLAERPEPPAAINHVIVQIHASGFVATEMEWPSTWIALAVTEPRPSNPGRELAGLVTAFGYGTTGLSVGQRGLGPTDWHRDGTLAEYVVREARDLVRLTGDAAFFVVSRSSRVCRALRSALAQLVRPVRQSCIASDLAWAAES